MNLLFIHKPSLVATSVFSHIFHALIFLINPSSKRNVSWHWFWQLLGPSRGFFNKLLGNGALHKDWHKETRVKLYNVSSIHSRLQHVTHVHVKSTVSELSSGGRGVSQGLVLHISFWIVLVGGPVWDFLYEAKLRSGQCSAEESCYAQIVFTPRQARAGRERFILGKCHWMPLKVVFWALTCAMNRFTIHLWLGRSFGLPSLYSPWWCALSEVKSGFLEQVWFFYTVIGKQIQWKRIKIIKIIKKNPATHFHFAICEWPCLWKPG